MPFALKEAQIMPGDPIYKQELLRTYELAGLRLLAWLHLGVAVVDIIGAIITAEGMLLISNLVVAIISFGIFLLIMLRVERVIHLERLGLLVALFDSISLLWLPASWYLFQGNASAPELLVKNDLVIFYILLAAIHSITLRPGQPLLVGVVGALVMTGCYWWAVSAGLPPVTNDWLTSINTRQLDVSSFWFKIWFMLQFGCGTLALLAWRGRQLVARSASQERSITALSRYFSPAIVSELINNDSLSSALNSQQRDVAVLFVDLVSFTHLSESLPPTEIVSLLADYYQRMVACVFANQGSVDKFLGDGLMATFNLLGDQPDAARQAVLTGVAMQEALRDLNELRRLDNLSPLKQRIGIHFGAAVVGNVGTPQRMEFTVIGDTVNTASRLQEICKELRVDFLISAAVYQQFPQAPVKDMGEVSVRGKSDPMRVYAVSG
ncbi:MAG: hypothetical protein CVU44_17800 [Chloroflexi bacterium HGW-Chloroflexi-6]|nr:MAG: hypothetical protein CVU44_17800 [Chloroflexi bacterium HGW-Chloroflexi-6]